MFYNSGYSYQPQQQQYSYQETRQPYYQQQYGIGAAVQPNGLKGRPVVSIEEARAAQIDLDGSLFIFTDVGNKKIYTKQINLDGTATLNIYELVEQKTPKEQFITQDDFNTTIESLRKEIEELKKKGQVVRNESKPVNTISNVKPPTF